jgi:hypothetical protein
MPVLLKLNQARKMFHERQLKKTGRNEFAGYDYFELADFLVPALQIFEAVQLSGVVSYGIEMATLTLTDLEDNTQFVITSPMSTAKLKACHEVQNLGAVQTYLRRYLWVAALEIVEHDALNKTQGKGSGIITAKGAMKEEYDQLSPDRQEVVDAVVEAIKERFAADDIIGAYDEYTGLDEQTTERFAAWYFLPANIRTALTKHKNSIKN